MAAHKGEQLNVQHKASLPVDLANMQILIGPEQYMHLVLITHSLSLEGGKEEVW